MQALETLPTIEVPAQMASAPVDDPCQLVFARYEIKYLVSDRQRARIEAVMSEHMTPDEWGPSTTRSIYYDTPSLLLARRSAEHPLYKEKIRMRSYHAAGPSDDVFCELKKKCHGVTYKRRFQSSYSYATRLLAGLVEPSGQIERELAFTRERYEGLQPAVFLAYDREAFYAFDDHEFRITFDRNIRWRRSELSLGAGTEGRALLERGTSCMEIKCAGAIPLWLVRVLSDEGLRKSHFSKYGAACAAALALGRAA